MNITGIVTIYIFCLLGESILASLKKFYWGLIIPIITSMVFLIILDESFYQLLFWETVVFIVIRCVLLIVNAIKGKKTQTDIEKSKIKDL